MVIPKKTMAIAFTTLLKKAQALLGQNTHLLINAGIKLIRYYNGKMLIY